MDKLDNSILGETDTALVCIGAEEQQAAAVAMIRQAGRSLDLFTWDLEPAVYDNEACHEAMLELALRSRFSRIRILVQDPAAVARRGHRILQLGMRLSSYIHLRKPAPEHEGMRETFLIADRVGVLHRPHLDSYKATANFRAPGEARSLSTLFDRVWESAEPSPYLRRLLL